MKKRVALAFTVNIIDELNGKNYRLENFEKDSQVLMKLLGKLEMTHLEEDLDNVKALCLKELGNNPEPEKGITERDKSAILRYL